MEGDHLNSEQKLGSAYPVYSESFHQTNKKLFCQCWLWKDQAAMAGKLWKNIWEALNTDVQIPWGEAVLGGIDSAKTTLEVVDKLADDKTKTVKDLAPLLGSMSSLLEVLDSPLVQLAGAALPYGSIAIKLLGFLQEQNRHVPSLEACIALVSQAAYLESLQAFLTSPDNQELRQQLPHTSASEAFTKKIKRLGEKLELDGKEFELDEDEANKMLFRFHESKLARVFNQLLTARLQDAGLSEAKAQRVTERVSRNTHRYVYKIVYKIVASDRDLARPLAFIYGDGRRRDSDMYSNIDEYLLEKIAQHPLEKVFGERFSIKDLYVAQKVKSVLKEITDSKKKNQVGSEQDKLVGGTVESQNIHTWVENMLLDPQKQGKVCFIQGGAGQGKSAFCSMFADWVRRELHPIWTPILIRLKDVESIESNLDEMLQVVVNERFAENDDGWLTNPNTRFLFFLDGFDELRSQLGTSDQLKKLFEQVDSFQRRCTDNSNDKGHRIIITGRPLALYGLRDIPPSFEQVEIIRMDTEVQNEWFAKWEVLAGVDATQKLRHFLEHEGFPDEVRQLAQEPLLLYLLAKMHRDDYLNTKMLEEAREGVKVRIYQQALDWAQTEQRSEELNLKITGLESEDLRSIWREAGLSVIQSGGRSTWYALIEKRLEVKEDENILNFLKKERQREEKYPLRNALTASYMETGGDGRIAFRHKSFAEFLCAEQLQESLQSWTLKRTRPPRAYEVSSEKLSKDIYDLFGYGNLTLEIVEYLMALLEKNQIDYTVLFERLKEFYLNWCKWNFTVEIEYEDTLPQQKARLLQEQAGIRTTQRKVDIFTGLNVLILLFELHRYADAKGLRERINFNPCSREENEKGNVAATRLLCIIGYSTCLQYNAFEIILGSFLQGAYLKDIYLANTSLASVNLSNADLRGTDLSGANLFSVNLSNADLRDTDLSGAYLYGANLSGANLSNASLNGAYLYGANLSGANLSNASLSGADLRAANLRGANLRAARLNGASFNSADFCGADLYGAILLGAILKKIVWNDKTKWFNSWSLDRAIGVPKALDQEAEFAFAVHLCRGHRLAIEGKLEEAIATYRTVETEIATYNDAQQLNPKLEISAKFWNLLCWHGNLHNSAEKVLFAAEKAVALEPNYGGWRDSRGIARAITGDRAGAIEDFQAAISSKDLSDSELPERQRWLEALCAGENPFTSEELETLRQRGTPNWQQHRK